MADDFALTYTIRFSPGLERLCDDLEAALLEGQKRAGHKYVALAQGQVEQVGAVAEGNLRDNIELQQPVTLKKATVEAPPVARLIERGRPPGKVPPWSVFEPILEKWARLKGLNITGSLYPIARKIREQGFKARFPFQKALDGGHSEIQAEYVAALRERFRL